jgi:hypothetical protein
MEAVTRKRPEAPKERKEDGVLICSTFLAVIRSIIYK